MASELAVGDTYTTKATDFLRTRGIPSGVDLVITNIDGKLVSLFLKFAHGKQCPSKITIVKAYFGVNFSEDPYAPRNVSYKQKDHYFPDANEESGPLLPAARHAP